MLLLFLAGEPAHASTRYYSIDTNQSSITVSGSIHNSYGNPTIQPQGTGSLSTTYSGSIKADRVGDDITFLSGSAIDANTNGNWQPFADGSDGSAAADYGGRATFVLIFVPIPVNFAARNLVANLASGSLPIDSGGHIDLSTTSMTFSSGSIAYRASTGDPASSGSLVGSSGTLTGLGTLSTLVQGLFTTETLTIPVNSSFVFQPDSSTMINLMLTGQLVATSTFKTPLPGDYNNSGVVDAADYVVWRKNYGSGISLPNDDTPGVGLDDYTRWRGRFGDSFSGGSSGSGLLTSAAVPEASTLELLVIAVVIGVVPCRHGLCT